jgi:hypothetical protein
MRPDLLGYTVLLGALLANPAAAADRMAMFDHGSEQNVAAGYVGATVSLLRSGDRKAEPSLSFGAGMRYTSRTELSAAMPSSALEFRLTAPGHGGLYIGGRRLAAAEGQGGLNAGEVLLIVAGIAASAFLVSQLADSEDDDDERCFIEPELCD